MVNFLVTFSEFLIFNENVVYSYDFVDFLNFSDFLKGVQQNPCFDLYQKKRATVTFPRVRSSYSLIKKFTLIGSLPRSPVVFA